MFLVERCLGVGDAEPERLVPTPTHPNPSSAKLTFFFDYASPWSYLAAHRMEHVLRSVAPVSVSVEWVPILVGALFKKIGTPVVRLEEVDAACSLCVYVCTLPSFLCMYVLQVPMSVMSDAKRLYMTKDIHDWCDYCGAKFNWSDAFPIRSVLPLRLTIAANSDPTLIKAICKSMIMSLDRILSLVFVSDVAAWRDNKDIGNKEVLHDCTNHRTVDYSLATSKHFLSWVVLYTCLSS